MNTARNYLYKETKLTVIPGGKKENKNNRFLLIFLILSVVSAIFIVNEFDGTVENSVESAINWNSPPCSPSELSADWEEVTHPEKRIKTMNKEFRNKKTKEVVEFHPKNSKGEDRPHWHRRNPFSKEKLKYYLDEDGNVVGKNSKKSHIYTNC